MLTPEDLTQLTAIVTAAKAETGAEIAAAEQRIVAAIATAMHAEIEASEARTATQIERIETALLTEFQKWASPAEARQRTHAAIRALDAEIEYHEDRIKKLESKQPQQ